MRNLHRRFVVPVKSTVEISQNFVAFSEYMNFTHDLSLNMQKNILIFENFFHLIVLLEFLTRSKEAGKIRLKPPA